MATPLRVPNVMMSFDAVTFKIKLEATSARAPLKDRICKSPFVTLRVMFPSAKTLTVAVVRAEITDIVSQVIKLLPFDPLKMRAIADGSLPPVTLIFVALRVIVAAELRSSARALAAEPPCTLMSPPTSTVIAPPKAAIRPKALTAVPPEMLRLPVTLVMETAPPLVSTETCVATGATTTFPPAWLMMMSPAPIFVTDVLKMTDPAAERVRELVVV